MSAPNPDAPTPAAPRAALPAAFVAAAPGGSSGGAAAAAPRERAIIHLDMDCFFASAATVGRPEFSGLPLAVCHSASERGSGEVSTANYAARAFGVRSGMFMAEAKRRCPELVVVPYEFDRYERIAMEVRGSGG
jgi:DNA repair protein REV1